MNAVHWGLLLLLSLLWGGSFLFGRIAVMEVPPLTLVLMRVMLAALTLAAVLAVARVALPTARAFWLAAVGMGLLNNVVPFSLIFYGQTQIGAGLASILNATTPLFTALVAHALTADEKLTPAKSGGLLLGFAGVITLLGPKAVAGLEASVVAMLACLSAALSYGFAAVFGRRFQRLGALPMQGAFGQLAASSVMMLPLAAFADRFWTLPIPSLPVVGAVVALAVISTGFAYLIYFRLIAEAGSTNAALVTLLIPVSAVLMGVVVLGEKVTATQIGGMALIGFGLLVLDGRLVRFIRRPA
jgi:drug/metabolite transporter (DMT)-like permease